MSANANGNGGMTVEQMISRAETLDQHADNEHEDEVEFYALRSEAAKLRRQAEELAEEQEAAELEAEEREAEANGLGV